MVWEVEERQAAGGFDKRPGETAEGEGAGFAALSEDAGLAFQIDDHPSQLLRRAHQRAGALFQTLVGDRAGSGGAVTAAQFAVLAKLYGSGELSQNHLGRLVAMDRATIQGVVRRLVGRGLVIERRDPGDRRRILLSLTAKGGLLTGRLIALVPPVTETFLQPLSPAERRQLILLLRRLG